MIRKGRLLAASVIALSIGASVAALVSGADPEPNALAQATALVDKAKQLLRDGKIEDAKSANDAALKLTPDFRDALVLDQIIANKIKAAASTTGSGAVATSAGAGGSEATVKNEKLTEEQIKVIRVLELSDEKPNAVTGVIDRKVLEDFWNKVLANDPTLKDGKDAFMAASFLEQAKKFRESADISFISKINITSEPKAMTGFRELNTWAVQNCATAAGCHSVDAGKGRFRIYREGAGTVQNIYTNFYIISHTRVGKDQLFDRGHPEESLIVQYALPGKHPGDVKVPARLSGMTDPTAKRLIGAIGGFDRLTPDYKLDYVLPGTPVSATVTPVTSAPASAPASAPTTKATPK